MVNFIRIVERSLLIYDHVRCHLHMLCTLHSSITNAKCGFSPFSPREYGENITFRTERTQIRTYLQHNATLLMLFHIIQAPADN